MAAQEPDLFSKVLCVDGVPFISAMDNSSISRQKIKNNPGYNAGIAAGNLNNMAEKEIRDNQLNSMLVTVNDTAHAKLLTHWAEASDRKTQRYTLSEMSSTDLRNEIAQITVPVLVLASTYGTKETSQKIFNDQYRLLPHKRILIAPTKHFIMYDDPLWFREQVKNFLTNGLAD
jgi:pimeloyl-ACP methyl ester carboxylesterase